MRIPSRLRTLLAAFALTASAAGCGDAPSPTAAADAAPRQGRMLSPGQASEVKPGDFIVYRPEDYAKYGIATFTTPSGGKTLRSYGCYYGPYGYSCCDPYGYYGYGYGDCCYDQFGNPTYNAGCDPQPCYEYDVNGGLITCGSDPCYDQYGTYLCGPPAQYNYGSSAPFDGEVNNGGIVLKQLRLISFSQSIANVASFTVDAAFKNVGAAGGAGCNNTPQAFDNAHASATGSPGYIEVSRVAQWLGTIKWQVDGVHSFAPVSGASGGGTFYTTANFCG